MACALGLPELASHNPFIRDLDEGLIQLAGELKIRVPRGGICAVPRRQARSGKKQRCGGQQQRAKFHNSHNER